MNNALELAKKIENTSQEIALPRPSVNTILTPTHRKELRDLRRRNVSDLQTKIFFIRSQKKDEYIKANQKQIEEELEIQNRAAAKINLSFNKMARQIQILVQKQKLAEDIVLKSNPKLAIQSGYGDIGQLSMNNLPTREVIIKNIPDQAKRIAEDEFKTNFGKAFSEIEENIEKLDQTYEEAINFGDLELVKSTYFQYKNAEAFLEKIRTMKAN